MGAALEMAKRQKKKEIEMRQQDRTTQEYLSEVEIGNLPEKKKKKLGELILKIIQDLRKIMEVQAKKTQEMFLKELEDLKNKQR